MDVCIVDVVVIGREKGALVMHEQHAEQTGQGLPPCVVIEEDVSKGKPSARRIAYCFDTLPLFVAFRPSVEHLRSEE